MPRESARLAPLGPQKSQRVSDVTLGGVYMRGGFNVQSVDGEWWCRKGEEQIGGTGGVRYGGCPWWWIFDASPTFGIIANPFYALGYTTAGAFSIYGPSVTEDIAVARGSNQATTATTRTINQMVLVDGAASTATDHVYRIVAVSGTTVTLDRPFESTSGTFSSDFIDPLPRNAAGTAAAYALTADTPIRGSAVMFEQLVTHSAAALHAGSPATTSGRTYLIITSEFGMPVAIDLTSTSAVLRTWFYNTALSSPAQIPTDAYTGLYAETYKNRLWIARAPDPNGAYGERTVWYSNYGDFLQWHVGKAPSAPTFKTLDGVNNPVSEMKPLGDDLIVHRHYSQEVVSETQAPAQPFTFRANHQGIGIGDRTTFVSNRCVVANGAQFIWTQQGPAVFDGGRVTLIADDARSDLNQYGMIRAPFRLNMVLHDPQRGLIYWIVNGTVHQDATASEQKTTLSGTTYQSRCTAWVYDYTSGASWFEDHPGIYGGGSSERIGGELTPVAIVSRADGTLLKLSAGDTGKDADLDDPDDSDADAVPAAQVDTPWLTFGANERKHIQKLEVALRDTQSRSRSYDLASDAQSDLSFFRVQIFGDYNDTDALADSAEAKDLDGATYASGIEFTDNNQPGLILLKYTLKASAQCLRFRFSNTLTAAALAAGYEMAPFRVSEVVVYYRVGESDHPNAIAN